MGGPFLDICRFSYDLYPDWVSRLKEDSGIDPEFLHSGSLGLAFDDDEKTLQEMEKKVTAQGFKSEWLSPAEARKKEPNLSPNIKAVWHLPHTRQVRPPRLTQALLKVVEKRGGVLRPEEEVLGFTREGNRVREVQTSRDRYEVESVVLAGGAWSKGLAERLGVSLPVRPVRGQVVLYRAQPGLLGHVLFSMAAYLVPRLDGRIYVGSTLEEAGFDKSVTTEAVASLTQGALGALPVLKDALVEATWSGLRPAPLDGLPYMGPVPGFENFWAATGHFTHGILLSAATGELMASLVAGQKPSQDLSAFALDRKLHPTAGI